MSAPVLTVVTAADSRYWRSLYQFLRSAERHRLTQRYRFIAYDLGLGARLARRLSRRFSWCDFRRFPFEQYPAHVAVERGNLAWKPIIVSDVLDETGGYVLWLDSATLFKTSDLAELETALRVTGLYVLKGQAPLAKRCHPAVLAALDVPKEMLDLPERAAGVIGLDAARPAIRALVADWRLHALIEARIAPSDPSFPSHRFDQALLTILLYRYAASGALALGDGEIDISSRKPVRWMSSRNKVAPWVPRWADPFVRACYSLGKTADQSTWKIKHWRDTRFNGLHRWPKENFTVFVARARDGAVARIKAPRWTYYADPFVWDRDGRAWLFAEQFDYLQCRGRLVCMPLDETLQAGAPRPILDLPVHASFPMVFEDGGDVYLVPETSANAAVDLYVAEEFPYRWALARRILFGVDAADSLVFRHDGLWWLITSLREEGIEGRYLAVYFTDDLLHGEWRDHPVNAARLYAGRPFSSFRNAGSITEVEGALLRPVQDNRHYYGESLQYMRIETLTPSEFYETPYQGSHRLARLAGACSPHHLSLSGGLIAWDVRDRVGFAERVPLLRPWARRPDPRVLRLVRVPAARLASSMPR